jgi:hypothetical protein
VRCKALTICLKCLRFTCMYVYTVPGPHTQCLVHLHVYVHRMLLLLSTICAFVGSPSRLATLPTSVLSIPAQPPMHILRHSNFSCLLGCKPGFQQRKVTLHGTTQNSSKTGRLCMHARHTQYIAPLSLESAAQHTIHVRKTFPNMSTCLA